MGVVNCAECKNNIRITGIGGNFNVKCSVFGNRRVPPACGKFQRRDKIQILVCPSCGVYMIKKGKGFFQCPDCGGEWWPPEKDDTEKKLTKAAMEAFEDIRVGFVPNQKKGGGSKCKNYGKKKVVKSFDARYMQA